jgi:S1-C subfamily serine protease
MYACNGGGQTPIQAASGEAWMSDGAGRGGAPDRPGGLSPADHPYPPELTGWYDMGSPSHLSQPSGPGGSLAEHELTGPHAPGGPHAPRGPRSPGGPGEPSRFGRARALARTRPLLVILVAALATALAGGLIGGYIGFKSAAGTPSSYSLGAVPPAMTNRPAVSVAGIAARVLPSVVEIKVNGAEGTGSGFVIHGGYIITDNHVVTLDGQVTHASLQVVFDNGQVEPARLVGADPFSDIAVIRLDQPFHLPALTMGNSASVEVGDPVLAVGSPLGLAGTVTSGIVSAVDRPVQPAAGVTGAAPQVYYDAIQTDAPINPGNSGGPLVNGQGQVIGIDAAIDTLGGDPVTGTQGGSIGLGFAIPVNMARVVATQLIRTGRAAHSVLGALISTSFTGNGAQIASARAGSGPPVTPGGPAAQAGLQPGDIITRFAGQPIASATALLDAIRSQPPGSRVTIAYVRGGASHTATLTLGSAESLPFSA